MSDKHQADQKKSGQVAAKEWLRTATIEDKIGVAACDFEYGETLDDLVKDEYPVPRSQEPNFSWGFYKQIKSHVYHAVKMAGR